MYYMREGPIVQSRLTIDSVILTRGLDRVGLMITRY